MVVSADSVHKFTLSASRVLQTEEQKKIFPGAADDGGCDITSRLQMVTLVTLQIICPPVSSLFKMK